VLPEVKLEKAVSKIAALELELGELYNSPNSPVHREEAAAAAISSRNDLKHTVEALREELTRHKEESMSVFTDMTRQYKSTQEELIRKVNEKEDKILQLQDQLGGLYGV
jgi:FtsZ-binding cell division protein ZapB